MAKARTRRRDWFFAIDERGLRIDRGLAFLGTYLEVQHFRNDFRTTELVFAFSLRMINKS